MYMVVRDTLMGAVSKPSLDEYYLLLKLILICMYDCMIIAIYVQSRNPFMILIISIYNQKLY